MQPKQRKASAEVASVTSAEAGGEGEYVPLPLIGKIQEKGFSSSQLASSNHWHRVSFPEPRVTPFPVARHRSEGPQWGSPSTQSTNTAGVAGDAKQDPEDGNGDQMASKAQPLSKRKKKVTDISKWKAGIGPEKADDVGMDSRSQPITVSAHTNVFLGQLDKQENQTPQLGSLVNTLADDRAVLATEVLSTTDSNECLSASAQLPSTSMSSREIKKTNPLNALENVSTMKESRLETATDLQITKVIRSPSGTSGDLSAMNECTLESMTNEQIIEAQKELKDRFRPDIIEMLRRRGKEKADKENRKDDGLDSFVAEASDFNTKVEDDGGQQLEQSITLAVKNNSASQSEWEGRCWTERVEAVRTFRFGLDGNFVAANSKNLLSTSDADDSCNQQNIPNVTERDVLRMDGNPSLYGYTINEAVALARSMVPAQRSAALRLVSNILNKAMLSFQQCGCESGHITLDTFETVDWQAIWAYALGPEPELVLTLRIALDDAHATAVVTSARAIEILLSSKENEHYFKLCESLLPSELCTFTAPVFKKPFFQESCLLGNCFWKYNVKPMDMHPDSKSSRSDVDYTDATVKDDAFVANQDVAAGLIRMGIVPRIRYLLEVERLTAAEESLFSILIALSRHSPAAADAVMSCPRLISTIYELFVLDETHTWSARHKAIKLLKVLSIAKKSNCIEILNLGMFERSQLRLVHCGLTLGGTKISQEESSLIELLEVLHFWRVCVKYGLCISCYPDYYTSLLFWIATPSCQSVKATFNERDASLAEASFRLLEAFADTLPILHHGEEPDQMMPELLDSWSWKFAIPIIDSSLGWLSSGFVQMVIVADRYDAAHTEVQIFLRVISSVLHFLSTICDRIMKNGKSGSQWLPAFVPKVCLQLIRSGMLCFDEAGGEDSSMFSWANHIFKQKVSEDYVLDVMNCLSGVTRLLKSLDHLLLSAKGKQLGEACAMDDSEVVQKILQCGLVMSVKKELFQLLKDMGDNFLWNASVVLKNVDNRRRGGPAPGLGIGWGCNGGGYWSLQMLTMQAKLLLLQELIALLSLKGLLCEGVPLVDETWSSANELLEPWRLELSLSILDLAGPHHRDLVEYIWNESVFKESLLASYIQKTESLVKKWLQKFPVGKSSQEVESLWNKQWHDVSEIKNIFLQHFRSVWLSQKGKCSSENNEDMEQKIARGCAISTSSILRSVPEDATIFSTSSKESLAVQLAGQKLPLPSFWFLSPLLTSPGFSGDCPDGEEMVRNGIMLLYVLEASMKSVQQIPVARIIHCLSSIFVMSDDFFLERGVNCLIGALQEKYMCELDSGSSDSESMEEIDLTDQTRSGKFATKNMGPKLDFEGLVDERYPMFLDKLISQFASVSYGDLIFSRQVAIYLTKDVSESIRLKVWKSLESEHMFEFLPPLEQCCGSCRSYLYPIEDSQDLLKAYASSLSSGALDRARNRQSVSFALATFHVAAFIFSNRDDDDSMLLRKTFAKNFLLQLVHRPQFEVVISDVLKCSVPTDLDLILHGVMGNFFSADANAMTLRHRFLKDACDQYTHIRERLRDLKII